MPTILVVEDELAVCHPYRDVLEASQLRCAWCRHGRRSCEEVQPDLLIVDIGLPDANGLDLLQYLRRPGRPAILTSGALSPELFATVRRLGFELAEKSNRPVYAWSASFSFFLDLLPR